MRRGAEKTKCKRTLNHVHFTFVMFRMSETNAMLKKFHCKVFCYFSLSATTQMVSKLSCATKESCLKLK